MRLLFISSLAVSILTFSSPIVSASPHVLVLNNSESVENAVQPLPELIWVYTLRFLEPLDLCSLAKTDKLRKAIVQDEIASKKVSMKAFSFEENWTQNHFGSAMPLSKIRQLKIERTFCPGRTGNDALWMSGLPLTLIELSLSVSIKSKQELFEFERFAEDLHRRSHIQALNLAFVTQHRLTAINIDAELAPKLGRILGTLTQLKSLNAPMIYVRESPEGQKWILAALENKENLEHLTFSKNKLSHILPAEWSHIFRNLPQLSSLELSSYDFEPNGMEPILQETVGRLTRFDLLGHYTEQDVAILMKYLPLCNQLKELSLSCTDSGIVNTERLREVLTKLSHLEALKYRNDLVNIEEPEERLRLGQAWQQVIQGLPRLRSLDLSRSHFGPEGGKCILTALQEKTHFIELNLNGCRFGSDLSESLGKVLGQASELQVLELSNLDFDTNEAESTWKKIQNLTKLKSLSFGENNLGSIDRDTLQTSFKNLQNLKSLDLSWNKFTADSCPHLAASLFNLSQLVDLDFSRNNMQGSLEAVRGLSRLARLRSLDLTYSHLGPLGSEALTIAIKEMPDLEKLLVGETQIGAQGVRRVLEALQTNKNLKVVAFFDSHFTHDEMTELQKIFDTLTLND